MCTCDSIGRPLEMKTFEGSEGVVMPLPPPPPTHPQTPPHPPAIYHPKRLASPRRLTPNVFAQPRIEEPWNHIGSREALGSRGARVTRRAGLESASLYRFGSQARVTRDPRLGPHALGTRALGTRPEVLGRCHLGTRRRSSMFLALVMVPRFLTSCAQP